MPYNIPTNPYLQGTVLNTDRFTNYYLQQQAHQKAKEEAFDRYNQELAKNLTPAGMRTKDVEGFTKKVMQWQDFNIKNREAINNPAIDGGRARSAANAMYQDALGDTVKSKAQVADDKLWGGAKTNPNIFDRITPEAMQKKALSEYSIYDRRYVPSSFNDDLQLDAAPFDLKKQEELDKIALSNIPLSISRKAIGASKTDPLKDIVEVNTSLSPENAVKAASTYADAYSFDKSVKRGIDEIAAKISPRQNMAGQLEIPKELERYTNLYQSYFPNDHFLNQDGSIDKKKLAFAYGLSRLPEQKTEQLEVLNESRKAKADEERARRTVIFSSNLQADREALKQQGASEYIEKRMQQLEGNPDAVIQTIVDPTSKKVLEAGKSIPLSPIDSKAFTYKTEKGEVAPDAIFVPNEKQGAYKVIVYKRSPIVTVKDETTGETSKKGGEIIKVDGKPMVDNSLTRTFTRQQAKEALAGTMFSGKIEQMELGQPKPPTPKTKTTVSNIPAFLRKK